MSQDGMVPRDEWAKTAVHQASTYRCGKCGRQFPDPHAVYEHLDAEHPTTSKKSRQQAHEDEVMRGRKEAGRPGTKGSGRRS